MLAVLSSLLLAVAPVPFEAVPVVKGTGQPGFPAIFAATATRLKQQALCDESEPKLSAADDDGNAWSVELGAKAGSVIVAIDDGPSGDPAVCVFDGKTRKHAGTLNATTLIVPGNGFLFTVATINVHAETRRKWRLQGAQVVEVPQPLLAIVDAPQPFVVGCANSPRAQPIGVSSPKPLVLRAAPDDKAAEVATLAAGTEARLLGRSYTAVDNERPAWVLVQTSFGLIGWARPVAQDALVDNACFSQRGD